MSHLECPKLSLLSMKILFIAGNLLWPIRESPKFLWHFMLLWFTGQWSHNAWDHKLIMYVLISSSCAISSLGPLRSLGQYFIHRSAPKITDPLVPHCPIEKVKWLWSQRSPGLGARRPVFQAPLPSKKNSEKDLTHINSFLWASVPLSLKWE